MVNNIIFGLTGPSGAGKSTAAVELAAEGCAVVDCDVLAHRVVEKNEECKTALAERFGQDILDVKRKLNRKLLGSRAFSGPEETKALNEITHPFILAAIREEIHRLKEAQKRYIVLDAPTLLESGCGELCDFILVVTAPYQTRKERICLRDSLTEEEAEKRLSAQPPEEFYMDHADFVLDGTAEAPNLIRKIRTILKTIEGGYDA